MERYPIQRFLEAVTSRENLSQVLHIYRTLTPDPLLYKWAANIERHLEEGSPYWDLASSLRQLADSLKANRYLEIGVRKGKSMAMAAATRPKASIYGFDLWIAPYAGDSNPGPDYVRAEMSRLGYCGPLHFIGGHSRQTVPEFARQNPDILFDLITVDGAHDDEGAWTDLVNVSRLVAPGGYIVFDDLIHPAHTLLRVWRRFEQEYEAGFEFSENLRDHNGTAVARCR
jgi:predicted O-methyltransferase YrrM